MSSMENSTDKKLNTSSSTIKDGSLKGESQPEIMKPSLNLKVFTHSHTE